MKGLFEYVQQINEGRPKKVSKDGTYFGTDPDKVKVGVPAEKNGTDGEWEVSVKKADDEPVVELSKEKLNKNMKRLIAKFAAKEDFFIEGRAGWGKTSIIIDLAKRYKRDVITVYLDKAVASDLGGIPVPVKGKGGAAQEMAIPAWAKYIEDRPDENFLLFFDEMNQAAPDVMNALMPIVLEHTLRMDGASSVIHYKEVKKKLELPDNFFVGAAGNLSEENEGGINALSGPLKSRFKPIIKWEVGTPEAWKQAFDYMRKKWGGPETDNLINLLEQHQEIFENPREVEHKILKHAFNMKKSPDKDLLDAEDYLDRLEGIVKDDLSRSQTEAMSDIADAIFDFINGNSVKDAGPAARRDMIDPDIAEVIKDAIVTGKVRGEDGKVYGVSEENIRNIDLASDEINAEQLEGLLDTFAEDGVKFKFKKNSEWKAKGYEDPEAD